MWWVNACLHIFIQQESRIFPKWHDMRNSSKFSISKKQYCFLRNIFMTKEPVIFFSNNNVIVVGFNIWACMLDLVPKTSSTKLQILCEHQLLKTNLCIAHLISNTWETTRRYSSWTGFFHSSYQCYTLFLSHCYVKTWTYSGTRRMVSHTLYSYNSPYCVLSGLGRTKDIWVTCFRAHSVQNKNCSVLVFARLSKVEGKHYG